MRAKVIAAALVAAGLLAGLAGPDAAAADVTVMAIGDSRVAGHPPDYDTWRYPLARSIADAGCEIDLVGPLDGPAYPARYDDDHASVGGYTTRDVLAHLSGVLREDGAPDVALLAIGGNDLAQGAGAGAVLARVDEIVATLLRANPETRVLVEQIAPGAPDFMTASLWARLEAFNDGLAVLVTQRSPQVIAVNTLDGWDDAMLADDLHFNAEGARHVAAAYFSVLSGPLGLC